MSTQPSILLGLVNEYQPMQSGVLVVDANGKTRGERCGLWSKWLSATACGLEYAQCWLSGHRMGDDHPPRMPWAV